MEIPGVRDASTCEMTFIVGKKSRGPSRFKKKGLGIGFALKICSQYASVTENVGEDVGNPTTRREN